MIAIATSVVLMISQINMIQVTMGTLLFWVYLYQQKVPMEIRNRAVGNRKTKK